jgi:uncharacterized membrane protein
MTWYVVPLIFVVAYLLVLILLRRAGREEE